MANPTLFTSLQQFIHLSVAPATRQTYNSGVNSFLQFCYRFNITPYPASSLTLQFFCADLAQRVSYKTLKVYLAGIRLTHLERGYSDPTSNEPLRLLIRGVRRFQGESSHQRLPITINLLRTIKQQLRISNFTLIEQRLLWAAFTTAFYAFLRASEFTSSANDSATLRWSDIQISSNTLIITLRQSKTDPFRRGHTLYISATTTSTCPVKALQQYTSLIPTEHRTGSLFKAGRFSPLSRTHVTDVLRQLLQEAGYDSHLYSSNSFRIGAATTSAAAGLPPWLIKTLGRWNSNAYMTYIRCSPHVLRWIPALMARTNASNQTAWNPDEH